MPQQLIRTVDGGIRVIDVGPIGPPGFSVPGGPGGGGGSAGNEFAAVSGFIYATDFTLPDGLDIEAFMATPLPFPNTMLFAFFGYGAPFDGIYLGTSNPATISDPDTWGAPSRVADLPTKAMTAHIWAHDMVSPGETGLFYTDLVGTGALNVWGPPIQIDRAVGGGSRPTDAWVVDLTAETGLPHPSWWPGDTPPDGAAVFPPLYPPELILPGPTDAVKYLEVDLSVLPYDNDTLCLRIPDGQWIIVPTDWPPLDRGAWSLDIRQVSNDDYNLVGFGSRISEMVYWGFIWTKTPPTVELHTTDGESWTRLKDPGWDYVCRILDITQASQAANIEELQSALSVAVGRIDTLDVQMADALSRITALEGP